MLTEAAKLNAKRSRQKYDAEHMAQLVTKLPREQADAFRALAEGRGTTVSRMLSDYVRTTLEEAGIMASTQKKDTQKKLPEGAIILAGETATALQAAAAASGVAAETLLEAVVAEWLVKWHNS